MRVKLPDARSLLLFRPADVGKSTATPYRYSGIHSFLKLARADNDWSGQWVPRNSGVDLFNYSEVLDMSNRIAIVSGASRGIGRATAIRLARDFSGIVLVARSADLLEQTAEAVRSAGSRPLTLGLDLREPAAAKRTVDKTLETFGRIDAVVNIAGAVPQVDVLEMTDEQWDDGFALKLHGADGSQFMHGTRSSNRTAR
jgi:hypothetical protein